MRNTSLIWFFFPPRFLLVRTQKTNCVKVELNYGKTWANLGPVYSHWCSYSGRKHRWLAAKLLLAHRERKSTSCPNYSRLPDFKKPLQSQQRLKLWDCLSNWCCTLKRCESINSRLPQLFPASSQDATPPRSRDAAQVEHRLVTMLLLASSN